jgi:penicillin-binding protein 2
MTERPHVLEELGEELDRAAQRVLTDRRTRLSLGGSMTALAVAGAVAVAVVAILVIGHRHPAPGQAGGRVAGASAPRGAVVDRGGRVLVGSRRAIDVRVVPAELPVPIRGQSPPALTAPPELTRPPAADQVVYDRLAGVLGISTRRQACAVGRRSPQLTEIACDVAHVVYRVPNTNVTVARDVAPAISRALSGHLPGVHEATVYLTTYPHRDLAAQVLGTVGPITAAEAQQPRFKGVPQIAVVGQIGLESFYDEYLRPGDTLKTSLDLGLEQAGQASLAKSIARNTPTRAGAGAGAFVAMNPQNGQVYAMGSLPSYDPNIFTKPISQSQYARLIRPASGEPLINRATSGLYATGSTFNPITAIAALESGTWRLGATYDDTGQYCFVAHGGICLHNAGNVANGVLDLASAIRVSDQVFFYNLGARLNVDPQSHPRGGPLQQWARLFGIGQSTGVDLAYEASGKLPDPIAYPGPWTVGDNVNLAIGQGDVLVTPLQLAVAYGAIANGGTIVRPHVGSAIETTGSHQVLQRIDPPPARHLDINPTYLHAIRHGLRRAASAPGGTSADVMGNFPMPVYGMTGTAQHVGRPDQAWYAGYVPASATSKPIVVVVTVEKGGFGALAAAPVARQILSQWFYGRPGPYLAGRSRTL